MILALILLGHLVGDWIVQTDWQAANKGRPEGFAATGVLEFAGTLTPAAADRIKASWLAGPTRRQRTWTSWKANQQHMLGYHLAMLAALAIAGLNVKALALVLAISWVTHSFIDRRWPVRWLMAHTGSAPFSETMWGVIAVDQALHLSILCILAAAVMR